MHGQRVKRFGSKWCKICKRRKCKRWTENIYPQFGTSSNISCLSLFFHLESWKWTTLSKLNLNETCYSTVSQKKTVNFASVVLFLFRLRTNVWAWRRFNTFPLCVRPRLFVGRLLRILQFSMNYWYVEKLEPVSVWPRASWLLRAVHPIPTKTNLISCLWNFETLLCCPLQ